MNDKPEPLKSYKTHTFSTSLDLIDSKQWKIHYDGCDDIDGGPAARFGGVEGLWDPESMMLASVNACHISTFVNYCQRKQFEFVSCTSEIEGLLEHDGTTFRFTRMVIRPRVVVKSQDDVNTAMEYLNKAHAVCFMGHSVKAEVTIEPVVEVE